MGQTSGCRTDVGAPSPRKPVDRIEMTMVRILQVVGPSGDANPCCPVLWGAIEELHQELDRLVNAERRSKGGAPSFATGASRRSDEGERYESSSRLDGDCPDHCFELFALGSCLCAKPAGRNAACRNAGHSCGGTCSGSGGGTHRDLGRGPSLVEFRQQRLATCGGDLRCPAEHPRPDDSVRGAGQEDRKSTRLNSSHGYISYAVFCLKKKNKTYTTHLLTKNKKTLQQIENNAGWI